MLSQDVSQDALPTPPTPLTPPQQRARRAAHHAFLAQEQQAGRLPRPPARSSRHVPALPPASPSPTPPASQRVSRAGGAPAGKRFHAHELRRLSVSVTPTARALIDASSAQGRLLPQALAEVFGEHPELVTVSVDAVEKAAAGGAPCGPMSCALTSHTRARATNWRTAGSSTPAHSATCTRRHICRASSQNAPRVNSCGSTVSTSSAPVPVTPRSTWHATTTIDRNTTYRNTGDGRRTTL